MLTEVRNQFKVTRLSIKYAVMRELLNKVTFLSNVIFMMLNNASMLVQWIVLYSIKDNMGGYTFKQVMLLWGFAAGTYGFSHFFFNNAGHLSEIITDGKLDAYLVQPKNVLLSAITSNVSISALGDILYGYVMLILYGITPLNFILFTLFSICGGLVLTCIAVMLASISFWVQKADMIADTGNSLMTNFATYPDGIFKGVSRILLLTVIPVGLTAYFPVWIMSEFNLMLTLITISVAIAITVLTFVIFYRGLRRYSSSNLMISKI